MFVNSSVAQVKTPEEIRMVTVEALRDVADAWRENSGQSLQIKVSDLNQALRIVAGGKADFALTLGSLTPGQKAVMTSTPGNVAMTHPIGWETLSLLVHPSNQIPSISLSSAQSLFAASGCIHTASPLQAWGDLPGSTGTLRSASIEVLMPLPGSPEEKALSNLVLGDCEPRKDCQILPTEAAMERCVAAHPAAIGVVSRLRFVPHARIVPISTESFGKEGASAGGNERNSLSKAGKTNHIPYSRPLAREINLISRRRFPPGSPQEAFVRYTVSAVGQAELARLGFDPLRKEE
jgi:hypothetical protein